MSVIRDIEQNFKKPHVVDVKSGDSVRVHQKIREAGKERVQVFEGLVIRTKSKNSLNSSITVRRVSSGVGVEKTFLLHSPLIKKIQVVKRSKVRRNYLSYMRARTGKSARLSAVDFDQDKVNYVPEPEVKEEPKAEQSEEETQKSEEQPIADEKKPEAEADEQKSEKAEEPKPKDPQEDKSDDQPQSQPQAKDKSEDKK